MATSAPGAPKLRSHVWLAHPDNADMRALYLEHYLNFGLSLDERQSGKLEPAVKDQRIAQTKGLRRDNH